MTAMAAAQLDIDDLVKAFAANHIGQQHIDIATIRDQLAQLLYSQTAAAAFQQQQHQQQHPQAAQSQADEPRKRCTSLASLDVAMDMDCDEPQTQPLAQFAPPNSPQRMHPAEHPFAAAAPAAHNLHIMPLSSPPAEPVPPPSSPVQPAPFFDSRAQREPVNIAAPF